MTAHQVDRVATAQCQAMPSASNQTFRQHHQLL